MWWPFTITWLARRRAACSCTTGASAPPRRWPARCGRRWTSPSTIRRPRHERAILRAARDARRGGHAARAAALFPVVGDIRLWRPHRAGGVHAARSGRAARLDHEEGLRRWTGPGAAGPGAAGRSAGHLSRLEQGRPGGRDRCGGGGHLAVLRDGDGPVRAVRTVRWPALDAERVLRHRRGGHAARAAALFPVVGDIRLW